MNTRKHLKVPEKAANYNIAAALSGACLRAHGI
jgi:hypothetical protein